TYEESVTHVGWLGAQAFLLLVAIVLALPGRRRDVDDDLPDAEGPAAAIAAQPSGDGRRARRLQAAAEAEAAAQGAQVPGESGAPGEPGEPGEYDAAGQEEGAYDPFEDAAAAYAAQPGYGTQDGAYDPYTVPAGADYGYQEGYVDPAYAQAGDPTGQWDSQQ